MTIDQFMSQHGWRESSSQNSAYSSKTRYWYKRFPNVTPGCQCNDDKPGVQLVVSEFVHGDHISYEIDITAESMTGVWMELKAYAIRGPDELMRVLDREIIRLVKAWEALNADG